jgi:DNA-binding NarL/FixJ family response regulator
VRKLRLSGLELAVLSFPLPCLRMPANLTAAEREVAVAMASGRSNAEIARERGTSVRTVANQAQRVFRKLGVASRQELATLLYGKGPGASRDPTG